MREIIKIIEKLENTSSTNGKIEIFKENKDNELLQKILLYTYDSNMKYGISEKVLNDILSKNMIGECGYKDIFIMLDNLSASNINNSLRRQINLFFNENKELEELYKRILLKDLRIGINSSTINKVWKNLIHEHKIMLASKFEGELKGKVAATTKMDGIRVSAIIENGKVKWLTRQGKEVLGMKELTEQILNITQGNLFIDGELLALNPKGLDSDDLFRETTKIINSKDNNKVGIRFVTFDICDLEDYKSGENNVKYLERRLYLEELICSNKQELIDVVKLHTVTDNVEDIQILLDKVVSDGNEGLILNYIDKPYEFKRSKVILKCKKFNDCDVLVLDIIEGMGQNKGKVGAITVQFEHKGNKYTCNVGTGLKQDERELYYNNKELIIGKIVTIGYFELSKNKDNKDYSMRFPSWKGIIRNDKTEISMY